MKFARMVYGIAAAYGFITLLPLYFLLERLGRDLPPSVTHPEFYYGFVGLALLWQMIFVLIANDPIRYRPLMLIAILEKFVYTVPVLILYSLGKAQPKVVGPSLVDPIFGVLFVMAYFRTRPALGAEVFEHVRTWSRGSVLRSRERDVKRRTIAMRQSPSKGTARD